MVGAVFSESFKVLLSFILLNPAYIDIYPNMKCIIYSGKNPETIESEIINIFIAKPFSTDQILNKINNLFKEKNE